MGQYLPPAPAAPAAQQTACAKCGSTVFVQKRGGLMTFLGIVGLFLVIVPGILILVFAPKHTECARCGKHL